MRMNRHDGVIIGVGMVIFYFMNFRGPLVVEEQDRI
jgi:hypothetical protein